MSERVSQLYALLVGSHFQRVLARTRRPSHREVALEALLVGVLYQHGNDDGHGSSLRVPRSVMLESDDANLQPEHHYDPASNEHVVVLVPRVEAPEVPSDAAVAGLVDGDGQPVEEPKLPTA